MQNQSLGLADALARDLSDAFVQTLITERGGHKPFAHLIETLPDLAIGCGRAARAELEVLKRRGVRTIYVQDPRRGYERFDLVVAPDHDGVNVPNALSMIGSPHRVTPDRLAAAKHAFPDLTTLPAPRVAVLLGGPSGRHDYTNSVLARHIGAMAKVLAQGGSLMVTTSRRTPASVRKNLATLSDKHPGKVQVFTGDGPNPYLVYLAHADAILVTEDSTNMLVEACRVGVPVFRLPMAGEPGKLAQLYDALEDRCGVVEFDGTLEGHIHAPLDETTRIAGLIRDRLNLV